MIRRCAFSSPCFGGTRSVRIMNPKSLRIIERKKVASVSKWSWQLCQQFTELVHDPTLALPTGKPLVPAAKVFAELDIDDNILLNPPKDKQIFEHCNIEKVMKRMGYRVGVDPFTSVLVDNRRMVTQLWLSRLEELSPHTRNGKKLDHCTVNFMALCGLADHPFDMTSRGC